MKTKIFEKLKQEYASLGLGDEFLQAHADSLANLGLVTDENIASVVSAQKSFLESAQKLNDKRVTDAVGKANKTATEKQTAAEKAAKDKEDALQKQIDELKKQLEGKKEPTPPTPPVPPKDDFEERFKAANATQAKLLEDMQNQLKAMQEESKNSKTALETLKKEKEELERKQAVAARAAKIDAKAKELGIPQSRIDEGFVIAEDADDAAIDSYLTKVSANIKNNTLPSNQHFSLQGKEVTKAEADNLASAMVV